MHVPDGWPPLISDEDRIRLTGRLIHPTPVTSGNVIAAAVESRTQSARRGASQRP